MTNGQSGLAETAIGSKTGALAVEGTFTRQVPAISVGKDEDVENLERWGASKTPGRGRNRILTGLRNHLFTHGSP